MRWIPLVPVLLGAWLYRGRHSIVNSILTNSTSSLPEGYLYVGDALSNCETLKAPELKYCEDVTFWDVHNGPNTEKVLVVTCDAGRKEWNTVMGPLQNPDPHGSIWLYSPSGKEPVRVTLQDYPAGHDFHPLGIEIYPSFAGNASNMYVVNHAREHTFIEQFVISPSSPSAKYVRTLSSPWFIAPNALALTSPDSFYVTNDHVMTRRLPYVGHVLPLLETVLTLPLSYTSHITLDPNPTSSTPILSHEIAAPFIPFSNGISISPSGEELAIASSSLSQIFFYTRNTTTNELKYKGTEKVPFASDNINYDESGALIVGGHPHFPTLAGVAAKKRDLAPSWVVALKPKTQESAAASPNASVEFDTAAPLSAQQNVPAPTNYELETIFQSNGNFFSSSSTGLRDLKAGKVYVAGLYAEEGVLVCNI
ncbi:hypothetical protein D9758_003669 [Tetrapyrgos nigripes]|uniref:Calcium-dependent phosphotriesterase n=1 Tax=Tetrapyrgos nigripes TaxID=182062 RepID=A0A8H5GM70_9AGAR|nr:hypothetical protein D9758_003669 [Tetrapyrgos nigripes]